MFNRKIVLEFTDVYYNMNDVLDAVVKYYKDKGILCSIIGKDNRSNPLLLINLRTYELKVKNLGPGYAQYTLPPDDQWPPSITNQQIILRQI